MLAKPSTKPLFAYKPSCFLNSTDVRNDYKLLYGTQILVRLKCYVNYHLPCTNTNPDGRHTSNNAPLMRKSLMTLNYSADESITTISYYLTLSRKVRDDFELSCRWEATTKIHMYIPVSESTTPLNTQTFAKTLNFHVRATASYSKKTPYIRIYTNYGRHSRNCVFREGSQVTVFEIYLSPPIFPFQRMYGTL